MTFGEGKIRLNIKKSQHIMTMIVGWIFQHQFLSLKYSWMRQIFNEIHYECKGILFYSLKNLFGANSEFQSNFDKIKLPVIKFPKRFTKKYDELKLLQSKHFSSVSIPSAMKPFL